MYALHYIFLELISSSPRTASVSSLVYAGLVHLKQSKDDKSITNIRILNIPKDQKELKYDRGSDFMVNKPRTSYSEL